MPTLACERVTFAWNGKDTTLFGKAMSNWFGKNSHGLTSSSASSQLMILILRGLFLALTIFVATGALLYFESQRALGLGYGFLVFVLLILFSVCVIGADLCSRSKQITTFSGIFFGLLAGAFVGNLVIDLLEPILKPYFRQLADDGQISETPWHLMRLFTTVVTCYIAVSILLQTKDDFRFIIPYVEFSKETKGPKPLVLDTSVIIDGRIADICETGIIDSVMVVPRFVLQELQGIADSSDKIKRNRGRRGLDILKRMQNTAKVELQMHEANLAQLRDVHKVDERLVVLCKVLNGRVVTNDFNLNKIAQLQGVEVINLNELANALKLVALPGENLTVRVVKPGDQPGQGVGYLDDGTMVVIEQGKSYVGQEVILTVTSVLQTPAGRMIFGKVEGNPGRN
jgi:uncharacterized protein YacL